MKECRPPLAVEEIAMPGAVESFKDNIIQREIERAGNCGLAATEVEALLRVRGADIELRAHRNASALARLDSFDRQFKL